MPTEKELRDLAYLVKECEDQNATIDIFPHKWGYTIQMNKTTVDILDFCFEFLKDRLGKFFKGEFAELISLCLQFKKRRIVEASGRSTDGYVRMVSPWVIPFALVVVRGSSGTDENLWFTVWDEKEKAWGQDAEYHECKTRNGPALAQHGDFLYCVHRGSGSDDSLWWTKYSTNDGWSDDKVFPSHFTESNISLVEFQNTLYCFHRGNNSNEELWYCTFDSERNTWNADMKIEVGDKKNIMYCYTGCAVAVFNENLHLVYQNRDNNQFDHLIFDGKAWLNNTKKPLGYTSDTPALVAYQNKLLLVHRGNEKYQGDDKMYYDTYDGTKWSGDSLIPDTYSKYGPGLAVFNDKVFMVHRGSGNEHHLYYSTYKDSTWSKNTKCPNVYTGAPPAISCYTDPQCNTDNYLDTTTAEPQLICVHRGYG